MNLVSHGGAEPSPGGRGYPRPKSSLGVTKLAAHRIRRDLTQLDLARRAGIPVDSYRKLERGEIDNPRLRDLVNCAIVLDLDPRELVVELVEEPWLRFRKPS